MKTFLRILSVFALVFCVSFIVDQGKMTFLVGFHCCLKNWWSGELKLINLFWNDNDCWTESIWYTKCVEIKSHSMKHFINIFELIQNSVDFCHRWHRTRAESYPKFYGSTRWAKVDYFWLSWFQVFDSNLQITPKQSWFSWKSLWRQKFGNPKRSGKNFENIT